MKRKIFAVVIGTLVAVVIVIAIESLGHTVYPVPGDIDFSDAAAVKAYTDSLPLGALLFVMLAWLVATLAGGVLASVIGQERALVYSAIVGGLVLFGAIVNLLSIPHPAWFSISSIAGIVVCILLAAKTGRSLQRPPGKQ